MPALRADLLTILKNELSNHYLHHLPALLDQSRPVEEQNEKNIARAFSAFTLRALCNASVVESARAVIDDFNDNGIDAIYFDQTSKALYLVQSKLKASEEFKQTEAQAFVDGLRQLLNSQFSSFNQNVLNRQSEIQSALHDAEKIVLVVCFTGQQVSTHAKDCLERFIESESQNEDRLETDIHYFDSVKVKDFLDQQHSYPTVSEKINFYNVIKVQTPRKTLYGQVKLKDLVELHERHSFALYQKNIRYFIGGNTAPNKAIKNTLIQEPNNFFLYNNGITALCSHFESAGSLGGGNNRKYKICNISVVNGAQTIATAYDFYKENGDQISDDAKVLVTVIQADSAQDIGKKITQNRNNQNPVDLTDFVALDNQQERLRREIKCWGYEYFYRPTELSSTARAITVDEAMRSLAMLEKNSTYPIRLKNNATLMLDLNSQEYQQVFSNALTGLKLLNTVLLYRHFNQIWNEHIQSASGQEKLIYKHANFVAFYIFSKRFKRELDKPVVASMTNLPANISTEIDALRLLIFNKTSSRLAGDSPHKFFKNSSSVINVLIDVMIEHFGKTTNSSVQGMLAISSPNESYPRANLVNYLTDNAPQLTLGSASP
ncbi:AIPR family protein [Acinetobacter nosocomialis]|uniref:AIPR family protein n=1 Tax=Acinetobacter calcoaceticus/baumannii complex TaxID=909768 RepID=UPI000450DEA5|nr:AIPR family protein [Acinetobacter baumannii]EXA87228.1 AIPR family protein [Acinetobacter baumannii 118362]SSS79024.1 AIPR protein [Acinetobacter baumannii]